MTISEHSDLPVRVVSPKHFPPQVSVNKSGYLELNLSGLHLVDLPSETWNFSRLEALRIGKNRLRGIPSSIGQLRKLKILHAQQNAIVILPDTLANCAHLTEVRILTVATLFIFLNGRVGRGSSSQIFVNHLFLYIQIDLSFNHLSSLPASFFKLKYIRLLRLAHNQFESIPHEMADMTSVWYLNISGNKLWHLPYPLQVM